MGKRVMPGEPVGLEEGGERLDNKMRGKRGRNAHCGTTDKGRELLLFCYAWIRQEQKQRLPQSKRLLILL